MKKQPFSHGTLIRAGARETMGDYARAVNAGDAWCLAVSDGQGSGGGGELASRAACGAAIESFAKRQQLDKAGLETLMAKAQSAISDLRQRSPGSPLRASMALLLTDGARFVFGSVGTARLYLFRNGSLEHCSAGMGGAGGESGQIQEGEGFLESELTETASLLLCTDGFWGALHETEMEIALAKAPEAQAWLDELDIRIASRMRSGQDNYSAVALIREP